MKNKILIRKINKNNKMGKIRIINNNKIILIIIKIIRKVNQIVITIIKINKSLIRKDLKHK